MPPANKRRMVSMDPSRLTTVKRTTTSQNNPPQRQRQGQEEPSQPSDDGRLWADKFRPTHPSELAVHPKKLALIHAWLSDALLGPPHTRKYRRLLILAGPAGAGKSAIIHALSISNTPPTPTASSSPAPLQPIGYDILEWRNSGNESTAGVQFMADASEWGFDAEVRR